MRIKNLLINLSAALFAAMLIGGGMYAQEFKVEKVTGKAFVLHGTEEIYSEIKKGQTLTGSDLIITEVNSLVQLSRDGNSFLLKGNSALGLNYIKEVSINDLLLALTMEEIRSLPKDKPDGAKSTAVYGAKEKPEGKIVIPENDFGYKRINGAKQLAVSGYKESAVIAAKETYRKYPSTRMLFDERLYFADLLKELGLAREALSEYNDITKNDLDENERNILIKRIEEASLAVANE
jgi:hypothetical protein